MEGEIVAGGGVLAAFSVGLLALVRDHFRRIERLLLRQTLASERIARRLAYLTRDELEEDELASEDRTPVESPAGLERRRRSRTPPATPAPAVAGPGPGYRPPGRPPTRG